MRGLKCINHQVYEVKGAAGRDMGGTLPHGQASQCPWIRLGEEVLGALPKTLYNPLVTNRHKCAG